MFILANQQQQEGTVLIIQQSYLSQPSSVMSLPGKRRQPSIGKKLKRSKSNESKKKMSFTVQQSNQISINTILQTTIKCSNQAVLSSQPNYRQSVLNLNREPVLQKPLHPGISEQSGSPKQVFSWQIWKIEQKRKIKGIKAKIQWCNGKDSNFIMVRVVLTDNYIRMNQPQYFMELDSSNLDLTLQEQKSIQAAINSQVEEEQNKAQLIKNQIFFWLKNTLISIHNLFMSMKLNTRKKAKVTEFKRSKLNKNYILYPSPASLTWSPHGMLCLTENKVGAVSIPIVGSIHSYRNIIDAPYKFERFSRKNNEVDDLKMVEERREDEEETTQAQFFGWNVKEEINFSIFGKLIEEEIIQLKPSKYSSQNYDKPEKKASKDYEMYYLGNTNNMTPKLQKIYRRHFCGSYENAQFQFLQKLKIFVVKSQSSQLEDGISYLIDKIQRYDRTGSIEALLENQFAGYNEAFNKYEKGVQKYERLKYELIGQFLQEKIKQSPQSQHFLYMKSVMVQNQFFRLALESYFEENFKKLKIVDRKYEQLGTFDNFDELKAQKILFFLLDELLKAQKSLKQQSQKIKYHYRNKPQKFEDPEYKKKKYAKMAELNMQMKLLLKGYVKKVPKNSQLSQSSSFKLLKSESGIHFQNFPKKKQRNVNLNLMPFLVINKIELSPLQFNLILNANQRKNFLETVIPILWIKDRSSQNFQYKLAKRVVITNSKIINFLEKVNSIVALWKKLELGRRSNFLKNIIKQYNRFEKRSGHRIGKTYTAYCQRCTGDFIAYSIQQLQRVKTCSRCKYLEGDQFIK